MSKKVLTPAAAGKIRALRDEVNEWGEPKYTGAEIAELLGVSESTIWRVVRKQAAYARVKAMPTEGQTLASMERTLTLLNTAPTETDPVTQSSLEKLQQDIMQKKVELEDPTKRVEGLLRGLTEGVKEKAKGFL